MAAGSSRAISLRAAILGALGGLGVYGETLAEVANSSAVRGFRVIGPKGGHVFGGTGVYGENQVGDGVYGVGGGGGTG